MNVGKRGGRYGVAPPTAPSQGRVSAQQRAALILDGLSRRPTVRVTDLAQTLGVHEETVRQDLARLQQPVPRVPAGRPGPPGRLSRTQRQDQLLALLSAHDELTVRALTQQLGVHEITVRRDLEHLAHLRLIHRDGPYVARTSAAPEFGFEVRRTLQAAAKATVATRALAYVRPGDRVGLDASSTALELARRVTDPTLTVYTTGLEAAQVLAERGVPVVLLGGVVSTEHRCVSTTESLTAGLTLDIAFFSCAACSETRGYREGRAEEARSKRALLERATCRVALLDQAKLGVRAAHPVAGPEDVDVLISDAPAERLVGLATRMGRPPSQAHHGRSS